MIFNFYNNILVLLPASLLFLSAAAASRVCVGQDSVALTSSSEQQEGQRRFYSQPVGVFI